MSARSVALARSLDPRVFLVVTIMNVTIVVAVAGIPESGPLLLASLTALPILGILGWLLVLRPQRGLLLLAALLPFHGLTQITPFPSAWKEALTLAVVVATFLAPESARGLGGRTLPRWVIPLGAFLALSLASSVLVGGGQALVGMKIGFFFVLVGLAAWRCPLDRRERDLLVTILMATGFVAALVGLAQQVAGAERLVDLGYEWNRTVRTAGGFLRSFSTFSLNFPFALFVMLVLLVGLPVALDDPRRLRNRLFLFSTPVLLAGLASSVTRAGWMGLLVGVLYLGITRYRALLTGLAHAFAIGVVIVIVFAGVGTTFLSAESTETRVNIWRDNIGQIGQHPFGLGIGSTGSAAEKLATIDDSSYEAYSTAVKDTLQPDNYYVKTALELGVLGLWVLVMLLVTCFTAAHMAARRLSGPDAAMARGVAANVLAAAMVSIVATYFEIFPLDAYFWLLLAVVATTAVSQGREEDSSDSLLTMTTPATGSSRPSPRPSMSS